HAPHPSPPHRELDEGKIHRVAPVCSTDCSPRRPNAAHGAGKYLWIGGSSDGTRIRYARVCLGANRVPTPSGTRLVAAQLREGSDRSRRIPAAEVRGASNPHRSETLHLLKVSRDPD